MTFDVLGDLNWLAVIVAALAYFILGGIWYAPPVMGKAWMKASGIDMADTEEGPPPIVFVAPLFGYLFAAAATAMIAVSTGTDTVSEGIVLGLVIGIGYAATLTAVMATFESKKPQPMMWAVITAVYNIIGLLITSVIISVWP
jgi:hypothetical protein